MFKKIEMKIFHIIAYLLLAAFFSAITPAQENRNADLVQTEPEPDKNPAKLYKGSYALVIGESNYTEGWRVLKGVSTDLPEVRNVLEKQGFNVQVVKDLKKDDLQKAIEKFIGDYGFDYENRLLIYYAGHGHTLKSEDDRGDIGYIVPIDAPLPTVNKIGFKQKTITMDDFQNYAEKIEAKHVLFVFDSCFSGKLISRSEIDVPPFIRENVKRSVRQFITSGTEEQTVPDYSIFRQFFVRGLEGDADENQDGFILGSEFGNYLSREVTNYSKNSQTPQYGKIRNSALDRGDFVFVGSKNPKQRPPIQTPIPPPKLKIFKTYTVNDYTKTDVCVEPDTQLSITASGSIYVGTFIGNKTPEGKDSFQTLFGITSWIEDKYYVERDIPHGALMCRMDYEQKWQYCSTLHTLKTEKKGCLVLDVNDTPKKDNKGSYSVTVKEL